MRKIIVIFGLLLLNLGYVNAQYSMSTKVTDSTALDAHNRFYVSLHGGLAQFYGDVSSDVYFPGTMMKGKIPWALSPRIGWDFNSRFGVRADLGINSLWAESNKPNQDIYFHASIYDIQASFVINMSNLVFPYRYNKKWNLTLYTGAGWMFYNSIARNSNDQILHVVGYDLNGNKTKREGERLWSAGVSVGYKIAKHLDLSMEVKINNSPTDKIDGVNIVLSEFDNYSSTTLGLTYFFGGNDQEWKWNPIDPFFNEILDSIQANDTSIVDLGNKVSMLQNCCENKPMTPQDLADDDLDSVPNVRDLEPNTPKGALVNWQGITIPTGPGTSGTPGNDPGKPGNNGQGGQGGTGGPGGPVVPLVGGGSAMFFNSVYFPFDKSTIDRPNYAEIVKVAQYLNAHPGTKLLISGNCDERGSNAYNDALSDRRVKAVKRILINDFGFSADTFSEQALGETKLFSQTTHWVNRRVDFFIVQ